MHIPHILNSSNLIVRAAVPFLRHLLCSFSVYWMVSIESLTVIKIVWRVISCVETLKLNYKMRYRAKVTEHLQVTPPTDERTCLLRMLLLQKTFVKGEMTLERGSQGLHTGFQGQGPV
jgi:hypothetical protein